MNEPTAASVDVVVRWSDTPIAVERLAPGEVFTVGTASGGPHHFLCDHASIPAPRFPLVESTARGVRVRSGDGMKLTVDGQRLRIADVVLAPGARASVRVGPLEITVVEDRRAPTVLDRLRDIVDQRLLKLSGVALALHAGFVMMVLLTTSSPPLDSLSTMRPQWARTILRPPTQRPLKSVETARAVEAPSSAKQASRAHPKKPAARSARDLALDAIRALVHGDAGATSSVFGSGDLAAGLSGLHGSAVAGGGDAGMGSRNTGGGVGGTGVSIGRLTGRGPGCEGCDVSLPVAGKAHQAIVVEKAPQHSDGLTREEIQRVMSRVMAQIKFCYVKELNMDPSLEGKLVMTWTIDSAGLVPTASVATSTFGAPAGAQVGTCVTRIISRLRFPAPSGASQVVVTYPLIFSSAGDQ